MRESVHFWETAQLSEKQEEIPEFISTHPSNAKRAENLNEILPWALDIRRQCNCYPLPVNKSLGELNLPKNSNEKVSITVRYQAKDQMNLLCRLWNHLINVWVVFLIFLLWKPRKKNSEFFIID